MSKPITFFVDSAWRKSDAAHIPLLFPFWGVALSDKTPFHKALFERYSFDTALYRISDNAAEADMVLMPYSHNTALAKFPELIGECAARAKELGKLVLIDGVGDIERPVDIPHAVILRYGGYRFKKDGREIHIPPYADDLLERYAGGELRVREKAQIPVVGFAGWARLAPLQRIKTLIKELPVRVLALVQPAYGACLKGVTLRRRALELLKASTEVHTTIIERESYSGHTETADTVPEELRQEFVSTILGSDYCLDVRGDANASTRLFEILSLGRIPVIVDTERNLPFEDKLDYAAFSVRVGFLELDTLPRRVARFHAGISPDRFKEMQRAARDAYTNYFRVDALMKHLAPELRRRINTHG